jgi:nucleoid-associated protein EbfC
MFGNLGNLMSMLGNMNKIAKEYKTIMAQLKDKRVEGSAGGDQVVAAANGMGEIVGIMIEELVLSAVHAAVEKARETARQQMGQLANIMPLDQIKGLLGNLSPEDLGKE